MSILILWPLASISWFKRHSKKLIAVAILFYTVVLAYTLFSERSFFWDFFYSLGRQERLSLTYFSFFSLAACAIYLTGWTISNDSETIYDLTLKCAISNGIFIFNFFIWGLAAIFTVVIPLISFGFVLILICNLRAQDRRETSLPLMILSGLICSIASFSLLRLSVTFNSFFGSVFYTFVILFLFLCAIKCLKLFRFAWLASAVWIVGIAIFMLSAAVPPALITDQMRLSSDGRFSYRVEIIDRGRDSEHVRLFTREEETGKESIIILPELSGSMVIEDGENFGDFVLWEDDRYLLFLDWRLWSGDTNWLAINEIDMSTESAVPFSQTDRGMLFWLSQELWFEARFMGRDFPSFAEMIQGREN